MSDTTVKVTRQRRTDADDLREVREQIARSKAQTEKYEARERAILAGIAQKAEGLKALLEGQES